MLTLAQVMQADGPVEVLTVNYVSRHLYWAQSSTLVQYDLITGQSRRRQCHGTVTALFVNPLNRSIFQVHSGCMTYNCFNVVRLKHSSGLQCCSASIVIVGLGG